MSADFDSLEQSTMRSGAWSAAGAACTCESEDHDVLRPGFDPDGVRQQGTQLHRVDTALQERLGSLILAASSRFLRATSAETGLHIDQCLAEIGQFVRADRSFVNIVDSDGIHVCLSHEWCAAGVASKRAHAGRFKIRNVGPLWYALAAGDVINIVTSRLSGNAASLHKMLQGVGIAATLVVPIISEGKVIGTFGFESVTEETHWPMALPRQMRMLGDILAGALYRARADEEIRRLNADLERRVVDRTRQLSMANKDLESFSYSVSHDLRAPLRHMMGYAGLLQQSLGDSLDAENRTMLAEISKAGLRMNDLIGGLLDSARLGRIAMQMQTVDVEALVADVVRTLTADRADGAIAWRIGLLPQVSGDPVLLRQVFVNLVSNAIKYSRPMVCAEIEVASLSGPTPQGETVYFVRDNGVGFDMQYAGRLFEMFQRLHPSDQFEGNGIGLAITANIVRRHGGRIWAESRLGEGACFYFALPERAAAIR